MILWNPLEQANQENAIRSLFNCDDHFSTANVDCQSDDDLLLATDSEADILRSSTSGSDSENSLLLASDEDDVNQKASRNYHTRRQSQATFLGKGVCVHALQALIGVGSGTVQRVRTGEHAFTNKRRQKTPKHPVFGFRLNHGAAEKWPQVVMFLWHVYQSSAEVMPTGFKMPHDTEVQVPENKDKDYEIRLVNHFLMSLQTYSSDPDVHLIGPGTFCGPCRYLQASSRTELYWEYYASCCAKNIKPASYSTFLRVCNSILKPGLRGGHLKFRGVNQHGKCNICFEKKLQIKKARNQELRQEAYRAYSHHLLSQWLDRQQYWSFRSMSQTWVKTAIEMGTKYLRLKI